MNQAVPFRLTPLDVSLFRDARPFSADDSTSARNITILPPQLGLLGAMRLLLLRESNLTFNRFAKGCGGPLEGASPGRPGSLRLGPVMLGFERDGQSQTVLEMPADCLRLGRARSGLVSAQADEWGYQVPTQSDVDNTSMPKGMAMLRPARVRSDGAGVRMISANDRFFVGPPHGKDRLSVDQLIPYLLGKQIDGSQRFADALPGIESRIGIKRDSKSFTAQEGMLYSAEFIRLKNNVFYCLPVLEGAEGFQRDSFIVSIGGEARPFEVRRDQAISVLPSNARSQVRDALLSGFSEQGALSFRLILLSPAPPNGGENGWLPNFPVVQGVSLVVFAAAVPKPRWLSGWVTSDGAGGRPRMARPYLPAGSVFFVSAEPGAGLSREEVVDRILDVFWYRSSVASGCDRFDECAGNGITLVGVIPNVN